MASVSPIPDSNAILREIFNSAVDSIFVKDLDLKYTEVNDSMAKLFAMPREALLGCSDAELFGEDAAVAIEEVDRRVIAGETIEEDATKPIDGVMRTFHVIKVPLRSEAGEIVGLCGIAREITAAKAAEEKLLEQTNLLAHYNRLGSMSETLLAMAHELNQPLTALANNAHVLTTIENMPAEAVELAQAMAEQAFRAGDIMRRFRGFVGNKGALASEIDCETQVRNAMVILDNALSQAKASLVIDSRAANLRVLMDPIHLQQVIQNLANNAIESMEAADRRQLRIQLDSVNDQAVITVSDSGAGLSMGARDIFEPFSSSKPGKVGLGLSISRSIVEQRGGSLKLENSEQGCAFVIRLPLA